MYCIKCGAQLGPEEKFCARCGAPVVAVSINDGKTACEPEAVSEPGEVAENADSAGEAVSETLSLESEKTTEAASGQELKTDETAPTVSDAAMNVTAAQAPHKKKVWPIIVAIVAVIALISVGAGLLINSLFHRFLARTVDRPGDMILTEEPEIYYGNDHDDFDPDEFDLDDFMSDEFGMEDLPEDIDEFLEEYGDMDSWEDFDEAGDEYTKEEYEYADAYYYEDSMFLEGRDVLKDSTVICSGKTLGEFCDYIDSNVLEKGRTINRKLLYDMLEVHLVDSELVGDNTEYFEQAMMYCLTFANEFGSSGLDIEVNDCFYYLDEPSTYYYDVEMEDKDDTWVVDYSNKTVFMGNGEKEYKSVGDYSMFSDNTLSLWLVVIDEFFDL